MIKTPCNLKFPLEAYCEAIWHIPAFLCFKFSEPSPLAKLKIYITKVMNPPLLSISPSPWRISFYFVSMTPTTWSLTTAIVQHWLCVLQFPWASCKLLHRFSGCLIFFYIYIVHFFIHSSVSRHVDTFTLSDIVNNAWITQDLTSSHISKHWNSYIVSCTSEPSLLGYM